MTGPVSHVRAPLPPVHVHRSARALGIAANMSEHAGRETARAGAATADAHQDPHAVHDHTMAAARPSMYPYDPAPSAIEERPSNVTTRGVPLADVPQHLSQIPSSVLINPASVADEDVDDDDDEDDEDEDDDDDDSDSDESDASSYAHLLMDPSLAASAAIQIPSTSLLASTRRAAPNPTRVADVVVSRPATSAAAAADSITGAPSAVAATPTGLGRGPTAEASASAKPMQSAAAMRFESSAPSASPDDKTAHDSALGTTSSVAHHPSHLHDTDADTKQMPTDARISDSSMDANAQSQAASEMATYRDPPKLHSRMSADWCIVCFENPCNTTLEPCGHSNLCDECVSRLAKRRCPTCRARAKRVRLYTSTPEHDGGQDQYGQTHTAGEGHKHTTTKVVVKTVKQLIAERRLRESRTLEDTLQVVFVGPADVGKRTLVRKLLRKYPLNADAGQGNDAGSEASSVTPDVFGNGTDFRPNAKIGSTLVRLSVLRRCELSPRRMLLDEVRVLRPDILVMCCSAHVGPTYDSMCALDKVIRANLSMPRVWALLTHPDLDDASPAATPHVAQLDHSHDIPATIAAITPPATRPLAHYLCATGDSFSIGLRSLLKDIVSYGREARDKALAAAVVQAEEQSATRGARGTNGATRATNVAGLSILTTDQERFAMARRQQERLFAQQLERQQRQQQQQRQQARRGTAAAAGADAQSASAAAARAVATTMQGAPDPMALASGARAISQRILGLPLESAGSRDSSSAGAASETDADAQRTGEALGTLGIGASRSWQGAVRTARENARDVNTSLNSFVSWFTGA